MSYQRLTLSGRLRNSRAMPDSARRDAILGLLNRGFQIGTAPFELENQPNDHAKNAQHEEQNQNVLRVINYIARPPCQIFVMLNEATPRVCCWLFLMWFLFIAACSSVFYPTRLSSTLSILSTPSRS